MASCASLVSIDNIGGSNRHLMYISSMKEFEIELLSYYFTCFYIVLAYLIKIKFNREVERINDFKSINWII